MKVKLAQFTSSSKVYSKNAYETVKKQYNMLYGIDYLEKQNETLQRIEKSLLESASQRREIQKNLSELQEKIRDTRNLIDKTPRNSDNYMVLFTNEHNLIKKEYENISRLKFEEEKEREMLSIFSENIRKAHQIDLVRQSRQKLLSFIYSIFGGMLGFFLNAYLNQYKNEFFTKEIDKIKDQHNLTLEELKQMDNKLNEILEFELKLEQKNVDIVPSQQISYSYMSYISYPFVKMYKLFF